RVKGRNSKAVIIAWWVGLLSIPVMTVMAIVSGGVGPIESGFWLPATVSALAGAITSVAMVRAYQISEVSLVAPLLNALPVFLLVSSFFILGERPSLAGVIGVMVISFGAYYINSHRNQRLLDPFRAVLSNKGARLILAVTVVWSITNNFDKIAIQHAPVTTQMLYVCITTWLALSFYVLPRRRLRREILPTLRRHWLKLGVIAFSHSAAVLFQIMAMSIGYVSYVLVVKRLDVLLAVAVASYLYKEKARRRRLTGAMVMLGGVAIMYLQM